MAEIPPPTPPSLPPRLPPPLIVPKNNRARASARQPRSNTTITPRPMLPPWPQGRPPFPAPRGQVWTSPSRPLSITSPTVHGGPNGTRPHGHFMFKPTGPRIPFRMPVPQPLSNHPYSHPRPFSSVHPQPQQFNQNAMVDTQRRGTGVFLPPLQPQAPITNKNPTRNMGARNKQQARKAKTYQVWVPKSPGPSRSIVGTEEKQKMEESDENNAFSDELGLPK